MTVAHSSLPPDPQDALYLANDILGVRAWGPASQPTLSVGRSDIWDRRWFAERQSLITLAHLKKLDAANRLYEISEQSPSNPYRIYSRYDFPCPKPGVQLILGTPFAQTCDARSDPSGQLLLNLTGPGKSLRAAAWVALTRPLMVIHCTTQGLSHGDLWFRIYRHNDTILPGGLLDPTLGGKPSATDFEPLPDPVAFSIDGDWGIEQLFHGEQTFPDGFRFAAVATVLRADATITCRQGECGLGTPLWAPYEGRINPGVVKRYTPINNAPGAAATADFKTLPESFTILLALATSHDDPDPRRVARRILDDARQLGIAGLEREQAVARQAAARSPRAVARVTLSSKAAIPLHRSVDNIAMPVDVGPGQLEIAAPSVVFPSLRRPDGYYGDVPLCSVGSTKFWFQDAGVWHNDFHLNEIRAEGMVTLGQYPELLPYCQMIRTLLPAACENAHDVYGLPGAMYPLVHFPLRCRGVAHTSVTWEQDLGLTGLVAKPLWLYYRHTGDREFLTQTAYPVLAEAARFSVAYLTPGDDGRLHIVPTISPEHWGLTPRFERNRNSASALTMTRYLLRSASAAAAILNRDAVEARAWRDAADRLAPLPTFAAADGPIWVDVEGAPPIEYNTPVPLSPIYWGDEIGLDSPPELLTIAKRTLANIKVTESHVYYLDNSVRPRLGMYRPGAPIGPENLLLSYQSIRLFPAVPSDAEIVMDNFAAEGGFRVSAIHTAQGQIRDVRIHSTRGEVCRLANPWPGQNIRLRSTDRVPQTAILHGSPVVEFPTAAGQTFELTPENSHPQK